MKARVAVTIKGGSSTDATQGLCTIPQQQQLKESHALAALSLVASPLA